MDSGTLRIELKGFHLRISRLEDHLVQWAEQQGMLGPLLCVELCRSIRPIFDDCKFRDQNAAPTELDMSNTSD
jgi:hypothetical protein